MVEDSRYKLGELFIFAIAVDGEGVAGHGGVDCVVNIGKERSSVRIVNSNVDDINITDGYNAPLGAAKWMTFPSSLNMLTSSMA